MVQTALLQLKTLPTPQENLAKAKEKIAEAAKGGAELIVLPEMFACPYENDCFTRFAMTQDDAFLQELAKTAKTHGIYLVAGTVPEREGERIYNTAFVFDPKGNRVAKHRKMHLFDINIKGGQYFMESAVFSAGKDVTVFDTPWGKFGLAVCYDIRFPELSRLMALEGAWAVILPAAFNMTTGPAHWELSLRARALDNQCYFLGCAPARDTNASYVAWGHSTVTDPWGRVVASLTEEEGILYAALEQKLVLDIREQLPLLQHRREDLYCLTKRNDTQNV